MRPDEWPVRRAAMVALGLMLGYFAVDNHVPLYPWNNLAAVSRFRGGRMTPTIAADPRSWRSPLSRLDCPQAEAGLRACS